MKQLRPRLPVALIVVAAAADLHAATTCQAVINDGSVAYWRFEQTTGTTAIDTIGSNDGTHTNGPIINQPGALPSGLSRSVLFDGQNDEHLVANGGHLQQRHQDDLHRRRCCQCHADAGNEPHGRPRQFEITRDHWCPGKRTHFESRQQNPALHRIHRRSGDLRHGLDPGPGAESLRSRRHHHPPARRGVDGDRARSSAASERSAPCAAGKCRFHH